MSPLELVQLTALMERTYGSPEVTIGLIDGPVSTQHPDLAGGHLREILGNAGGTCARAESMACLHGTFVAGILCGNRHSRAPAICPNCTLLIRPIFAETTSEHDSVPRTTPLELATAIVECINAGARVINLSLALARPSANGEQVLEDALNQAARRGVIVVAAAGNQSALGGSTITRHPGVIPVASCDVQGRPMNETNLGGSIGRWGLSAPGDGITSLGSERQSFPFRGTSIAAPFVTGAIALLWSEFPTATAAQIKLALTRTTPPRRASVVPPLLNAAAADRVLSMAVARSRIA
jgi:subtilisin family serine protease